MITYALLLLLLKISNSAAEKVVVGNVSNSFIDAGIVPDLIKLAPKDLLRVSDGNILWVQLNCSTSLTPRYDILKMSPFNSATF
jgi:hypothetical protein